MVFGLLWNSLFKQRAMCVGIFATSDINWPPHKMPYLVKRVNSDIQRALRNGHSEMCWSHGECQYAVALALGNPELCALSEAWFSGFWGKWDDKLRTKKCHTLPINWNGGRTFSSIDLEIAEAFLHCLVLLIIFCQAIELCVVSSTLSSCSSLRSGQYCSGCTYMYSRCPSLETRVWASEVWHRKELIRMRNIGQYGVCKISRIAKKGEILLYERNRYCRW